MCGARINNVLIFAHTALFFNPLSVATIILFNIEAFCFFHILLKSCIFANRFQMKAEEADGYKKIQYVGR